MKNLRLVTSFALFAMLASLARALTVIYPVDAIQDLWNLAADDFRQKYSGINISGLGPSDEGWYVRYRHENLTYLFGPLPDREEARKKKWEMETVRDAAIRNRPTLQSSEVDFVRFTFSGAFGKGGNSPYGAGGGPRISKDGRSGPDGDLDGDGIPNYLDDDMDGDGIPNAQDDDIDGDGIPNAKDDYMYGKNPALEGAGTGADGLAKDGSEGGDGRGGAGEGADGGSGKGGKGGKRGKGGQGGQGGADGDDVRGETLAGLDGSGGDGNQGGAGGKSGSRSGRPGGQGGAGGSDGADGDDSAFGGQQGSRGQGGRQVASNQRGTGGAQGGQAGGQQGGGQQGGQQGGGQQGGGGSAGGQSGGQGQPGGGSAGAAGSSGGGGNPLDLVVGLLRAILGI